MAKKLARSRAQIAYRLGLFVLIILTAACTCSPFGFNFSRFAPRLQEPDISVEGVAPLDEITEDATEAPIPTEPPPATEAATAHPPPSPTASVLIPNGEASVSGRFFDGSGDCMANPADFTVPVLIVSVHDGLMELEQPEVHLNTGAIDHETAIFDIGTGKGDNSEGYMGVLTPNFSATGEYRYTTAAGTCFYSFILTPN